MTVKKEVETRIKVKRIGIRGDEVAILFFSLVFLAFLFISFFRLLPIGKLFDDFLFLLLFGWTKYLVYLVLFSIILPICLNFYFKIKLSFIFAMFFTLFAISWLVANINLLVTSISTNTSNDIWWKINPFDFNHFRDYIQKWWDSTIINNYHGFFAQPISFNNWRDISTFLPTFATGGIIANFLIMICNYGFFITNWILNIIVLFISVSWLLFAKPWLLFAVFYFSFRPINKYLKQKKINRISKKSLENKDFLDTAEKNNRLETNNPAKNVKQEEILSKSVKNPTTPIVKEKKKEILLQNMIQESGTLTPFGRVKQKEESSNNSD